MLESAFQKKVLKDLATLKESWVLKTQERGRRGVPDIHVCIKGRAVWIELKTDTGKIAPLQMLTLSKIEAAGGLAFVARPSSWQQQFWLLQTL